MLQPDLRSNRAGQAGRSAISDASPKQQTAIDTYPGHKLLIGLALLNLAFGAKMLLRDKVLALTEHPGERGRRWAMPVQGAFTIGTATTCTSSRVTSEPGLLQRQSW
jgi:hypothetical protein